MQRTRDLAILGATGSIGCSTLDVVSRHPDEYRVHALTAHTSADELESLCVRHNPRYAVLSGLPEDTALRRRLRGAGCPTELLFGAAGLLQAVEECDAVMAAIVGAAGLAPTLHAAGLGKQVLLANKEALVMAGPVFMRKARDAGAVLLPIDSEHNAVFQCLPTDASGRAKVSEVRRILLTASGGPFRTAPLEKLGAVTPDEACAHPNWSMGRKISVDSATMMNKGLEVIEARWLFDVEPSRIEVVIHPQSIIHSLVDYVDGSVIAQLSNPDMRVPIAHALAYPRRMESGAKPLDLAAIGQLSFEPPDLQRFPCLGLAYAALRAGGTAPAILNAANEVAVDAFLRGRLGYTAIAQVIEEVLGRLEGGEADTLERVLEADRSARACAAQCVENRTERAA
ncbi:MAG: 1-deoxy-D-xylulose-5-phosphate reductoisomerase [Proteobacteria bacterium]|nr:1-deoxy-D-xylulose-5-phosphate reductoisomerase [Pseudomonadota bacterium]